MFILLPLDYFGSTGNKPTTRTLTSLLNHILTGRLMANVELVLMLVSLPEAQSCVNTVSCAEVQTHLHSLSHPQVKLSLETSIQINQIQYNPSQ
jgi:hypothetical protein